MNRGPLLLSVQLVVAAAYAGNSGLRFDAPGQDPGTHRMQLTLEGDSRIARDVMQLARKRSRPARLSLVVGRDGRSTSGDVYNLRDASVASVERVGSALKAVLEFRGLEVLSALAADPPLNAPAIDREGPNRGWILGLPDRDAEAPAEIEVLDLVAPSGNGRLALRLGSGAQASIAPPVGGGAAWLGSVVLVLPDRRQLRYVEYKLWDATLRRFQSTGGAGCDLEFRAPVIVCMTGAASPSSAITSVSSLPREPRQRKREP